IGGDRHGEVEPRLRACRRDPPDAPGVSPPRAGQRVHLQPGSRPRLSRQRIRSGHPPDRARRPARDAADRAQPRHRPAGGSRRGGASLRSHRRTRPPARHHAPCAGASRRDRPGDRVHSRRRPARRTRRRCRHRPLGDRGDAREPLLARRGSGRHRCRQGAAAMSETERDTVGQDGERPPEAVPPADAPPSRAHARGVALAATRRRGGVRFVTMVVVPLLLVLAGIVYYWQGGRYVGTDNAYVKADKVLISTEVAGRIAEVLVSENQPVEAGQPLLRLDPAPFRIALARAEAQLAQVRTELRVLKASYREKQASLEMARTRAEFARREQRRRADLRERNFVSAASFDDAHQALELARQQIAVDEQDLVRIAESLGGGPDVAIEEHPNYVAALAELDRARLDLDRVE